MGLVGRITVGCGFGGLPGPWVLSTRGGVEVGSAEGVVKGRMAVPNTSPPVCDGLALELDSGAKVTLPSTDWPEGAPDG
jgi:hypothetical protein